MQSEAAARSLNSEATKTMSINLVGNLNSCIVKINKQRFRSLVDTGAMCSLLNRKIQTARKGRFYGFNIKIEKRIKLFKVHPT